MVEDEPILEKEEFKDFDSETYRKQVQERSKGCTRTEKYKYLNQGKEVLKLPPSSTGKKKDIYMKREREVQQSAE